MTDILLAKRAPIVALTDSQKALLTAIDGADEESRRAWRRFWRRVLRAAPGAVFEISARQPRNARFHRKFFALLKLGYDAWQPPRRRMKYRGRPVAKSFEAFREEVTILAGFYEQTFDLAGRLQLRARSISFARMGEDEFERLYSAVIDVLLARVLTTYRDRAAVDRVVEQLMEFAA